MLKHFSLAMSISGSRSSKPNHKPTSAQLLTPQSFAVSTLTNRANCLDYDNMLQQFASSDRRKSLDHKPSL
jgi:hypothetical protein